MFQIIQMRWDNWNEMCKIKLNINVSFSIFLKLWIIGEFNKVELDLLHFKDPVGMKMKYSV